MIDRKRAIQVKKTMAGLTATLRHCHNLYNKFSENQQELAEMNQAAKDAIALIREQEAEIRQLKFALDIAKGACKGINVEGGEVNA